MKTKKLVCYNCGGHGFITATYENGQTSAICPVCGGIGSHEIQMTNADRIRAMSDEELAVFLVNYLGDVEYCHAGLCKDGETCRICCLRWLQQTVGEEDKHEP